MTRLFDALRKSGASPRAAAPGHAAPAAFGHAPEPARVAVPLLGAMPIDDTVVREMSALNVTLEAALRERSQRVLMFVGPQGGEGASTIALQYAEALARDPRCRPLLVDCHAQRPAYVVDDAGRCARLAPGFAAASGGSGDVVPANLFVVPVPEADRAAGIIQPESLRETLRATAGGFDWVILDGPPVLQAPESAALAAVADAVVIVVQGGRTKRPVLTRTADLLGKAGARVIGSVLNRRVHEIPEFLYRRI